MSAGLILLVLVIGLAVVAVVAAPFVRPERDPDRGQSDRLAELEARKEAKYREIRDAELDHRMGKLSRDDWRSVDSDLRAEAIEILRQLDRLECRVPEGGMDR